MRPAAVEAMGLCALASPDDIARLTPQRRVVDLAGKAAWALAGQHRDVAATGYRQLLFLAKANRRAGREADAGRETAEFEKTKVQQDSPGGPALHPFGIPQKN